MAVFSDDEFYEARDEISSASSDESSDDNATGIDGKQQRSRRQEFSKPPRHNQPPPPQWLAESRFSVWQDGPKSIQERRRLLYERFGILGRKKDEKKDGLEDPTSPGSRDSYEGTQIRVTRFGIREHVSPARKGLGRASNSSIDACSPEFGFPNGNGGIGRENLATDSFGSADDEPCYGGESSESSMDVKGLMLGRSRSESAALFAEGKIGESEMGATAQSADAASPFSVRGIERLMETSGAVLREGKWGPSSSKPPTGNRPVALASKSAPSNLHYLAVQFEKMSNGTQSFTLENREVHPSTPDVPSAATSPTRVLVSRKLVSSEMTSGMPLSSNKTWAMGEEFVFDSTSGHLPSNSVGGLVHALQNMAGAAGIPNQNRSPTFDESMNDIACKIKDLDSGKEFIIDKLGADGDPKLRELDTGKELTLEEFESSLGLSPVMQEVRRREREQDNLDDDDTAQGHDSTAPSKRKNSLWVRTMKGVAKTVGGVSKTKSHQGPSKVQGEGRKGETGGEELEGSVDRESRIEGSAGKGSRRPHSTGVKRVSDERPESLRPRSPQRIKVQVCKKNFKDLSDLNLGQVIQAHQGAIWTMKFSLDGHYLASAGQDRVVHVREVVDHPFIKDQVAKDGVGDSTGGKLDIAGGATPDHLQQSQEGSQGKRASLRGSMGKKKSSKSNSSSKLPKLFWLSETPVCSFKGHTEDVLDLSWSRSQFLLSSSMDKTVRLWHISYGDCLRVFTHNDYVTCIEFSPTDDRYFLSGSLDDKVRIWSIPDHQVVDWSDVREMVTAASYSSDGKRAVIGTYKGTCRFFNTSGHKLQLDGQIDVRNAQSKKSRGKKITGLQFMPGEPNKVLITSNDSRIRVYDGLELNLKFKGLRNINSQISASFSRSGDYIVSASEDSRVYIWNPGLQEFRGSRKDKLQSYEHFPSSHVSIAVPWPGMDPQSVVGVAKEDRSEFDTSSSRQSANDGPLRSPLRCSPCSSSSSRSNGSTQSESGLTSESVGECKSEQSISYLVRNGSGREAGEEEVTSRRSDGNGSFRGHYDKHQTVQNTFGESPSRDDGLQASARSPALSISNESPLLRLSSLRSPSSSSSLFADITPKGSATWPEEKLPPLQDSVRSQGGSWSASSPSQDILSTELSPVGSTAGDDMTVASWGLVIVTASLGGEIRTFQNYGYPIRL